MNENVELPRVEYALLVQDSALLDIVIRIVKDPNQADYAKVEFLQQLLAVSGKRQNNG